MAWYDFTYRSEAAEAIAAPLAARRLITGGGAAAGARRRARRRNSRNVGNHDNYRRT